MSVHEFGIMQSEPIKGIRFDRYESEKYNCICVDDDFIEPILSELSEIDFYWHTVDVPGKGLAYYGINSKMYLYLNVIYILVLQSIAVEWRLIWQKYYVLQGH